MDRFAQYTDDQLKAAAKRALAAGDREAARRLFEFAQKRQGAAPEREHSQPNSDGTYGQPPEDMVWDRNRQVWTSRELMANNMQPTRGRAAIDGASQGMSFGSFDEMAGIVSDFERERARARLDASRRDHPGISLASEVAGAVAMPLPGGKFIGTGSTAARIGKGAVAGGLLGGLYGFNTGEGDAASRAENAIVPGLLGAGIGGVAPAVVEGVRGVAGKTSRAAAKRMAREAETVDQLRARGGEIFNEARATGQTVGQNQTGDLAGRLREIAQREGAITPAGRVDPGMTGVSHALNMADDFATGSMRPEQYNAFRNALERAARSKDGSERRLGTMMLREFDTFAEQNLSPLFREGNAVLSRAHRGQMIDDAIMRAENKAGTFSGSGFENALRSEFRALSQRLVKNKNHGLTPDQVAAINRVARGGKVENALRDLGKMAPTGVVSTALGGGLPFLIGNSVGGPGVGVGAGLLSMAAGGASRRAATSMQRTNADIAGALLRSADGRMPSAAPMGYEDILRILMQRSAPPLMSQIPN